MALDAPKPTVFTSPAERGGAPIFIGLRWLRSRSRPRQLTAALVVLATTVRAYAEETVIDTYRRGQPVSVAVDSAQLVKLRTGPSKHVEPLAPSLAAGSLAHKLGRT